MHTASIYSQLKKINIEPGYLAPSTLPRPAYLDERSDVYRNMYGPLVIPINIKHQEFTPNVVVTDVTAAGEVTYACIDETACIQWTAHGLIGSLYIDENGELTDVSPSGGTEPIGVALDVDTLKFFAGDPNLKPTPFAMRFTDAKGYTKFSHSSLASASLIGGTAEVHIDDAVSNAAPTSADLVEALDSDDKAFRRLNFSSDCLGLSVVFDRKTYVDTMVVAFAHLQNWVGVSPEAAPPRDNCYVHVFTNAGDAAPSKIIKMWDATLDGPVDHTFWGLEFDVDVRAQAERIELHWPSRTPATTIASGGIIHNLQFYGQPVLTTIEVLPAGPKLYNRFDRVSIPMAQKPMLTAGRPEDEETYQSIDGSGYWVDEVYLQEVYGTVQTYGSGFPPPTTEYPDDRSIREWSSTGLVNGSIYDGRRFLSIDMERPELAFTATQTVAEQEEVIVRFKRIVSQLRKCVPNVLIGIYDFPKFWANVLGAYVNRSLGTGQGSYGRIHIQEDIAYRIFEFVDIAFPPAYALSLPQGNWAVGVEFYKRLCEDYGVLCMPHYSSRDSATRTIASDNKDRIRYIMRTCDGIVKWSNAADAGTDALGNPLFPWTEADKQQDAQDWREVEAEIRTDCGVPIVGAPGVTTPDVSGSTSKYRSFRTSGAGDDYTFFEGACEGDLIAVEVQAGDRIIHAGSGAITLNGGTTFDPSVNGGALLLMDKGVNGQVQVGSAAIY